MSTSPLTVYVDENYNGLKLDLTFGQYPSVSNIGIPNDSITSLRVAAFTRVLLYENDSFDGTMITLLGPINIPNLKYYSGGFNDTISSIQVISLPPTLDFQAGCCRGTNDASQCGKYIPGSAACNTTLSQYCANNMNTAACQQYCRANSAVCDSYVATYCDRNPSDPYCACIKSPAQVKNIVNPKCADGKCLSTGYLTTAMQNSNCPSIVDCSIQTSLQNNGVLLSYSVPVAQNCGAPPTTPPVKPPVKPPVTTPPVTTPITGTGVTGSDAIASAFYTLAADWLSSHIFVILAFLFFVMFAIIGGLFLFSMPDDVSDVMPVGMPDSVQKNMAV